jgi:hypothetical protein
MGFLDRIMGRLDLEPETLPADAATGDLRAVDRYDRLLRTADRDTIERAHVEAFERLTPTQLDLLFQRFAAGAPGEDAPADARPESLARTAARVETRERGALRRLLGRDATSGAASGGTIGAAAGAAPGTAPGTAAGAAPGTGSADWTGAALLDTVATYAIASAVWDTWDVDGVASGWGWFDEFDL